MYYTRLDYVRTYTRTRLYCSRELFPVPAGYVVYYIYGAVLEIELVINGLVDSPTERPVSYTHLTLPTTYPV